MDGKWNTPRERDEYYMGLAIAEAQAAAARGEVPVGAVIVQDDRILASCGNRREELKNALSHAESDAIKEACAVLGGWRLPRCELFVTMEPCPMCAGAVVNARIPRVVVGVKDARAGAFGSLLNLNHYPLNHKPEVIFGVREEECLAVLRSFFAARRKKRET